jgi:prepilin-type N-terminal cleavage/methylation domain-containing protein
MFSRRRAQSGYTLIEIMIAILILAIGFLALIAVQLGALNGYVSARDNTEATEVGRRISDLLRVQGQSWWEGGYPGDTVAYSGDDTPFDVDDPIKAADSADGWVRLFDDPVDARLSRKAFDEDHVGGRYCAYLRGGTLPGAADGSVKTFQIAVVYPAANVTLRSCLPPGDGLIDPDDLDDVGSTTSPPALEAQGLRTNYFGTVVTRRSWLADQ